MLEFEELPIEVDQENVPNLINVSQIGQKQPSEILINHKGHVKQSEYSSFRSELHNIYTSRRKSRQDIWIKLSKLDSPANGQAQQSRANFMQNKSVSQIVESKFYSIKCLLNSTSTLVKMDYLKVSAVSKKTVTQSRKPQMKHRRNSHNRAISKPRKLRQRSRSRRRQRKSMTSPYQVEPLVTMGDVEAADC